VKRVRLPFAFAVQEIEALGAETLDVELTVFAADELVLEQFVGVLA